jgi:hypothetical protein
LFFGIFNFWLRHMSRFRLDSVCTKHVDKSAQHGRVDFSCFVNFKLNSYYISALHYIFVAFDIYVRSTARHAIHLQFDISANALGIRAVQSPKCTFWCDSEKIYRDDWRDCALIKHCKLVLGLQKKRFKLFFLLKTCVC